MEEINNKYNETLKEIESYNPDEAFENIMTELNRKTKRNFDEFWIEFSDIKNNSIGNKKSKKRVGKIKSGLLVLLAGSLLFGITACKSDLDKPVEPIIDTSYEEVLNNFKLSLEREAYDKGVSIGNEMYTKLMNNYSNGVYDFISSDDIICKIAYLIDGDEWYNNFDANFSLLGVGNYDDLKYVVAGQLYEGIIGTINSAEMPKSLDELCESLVGDNLVIYIEESNELAYIPVSEALSEKDKVNNIIELFKYYSSVRENNASYQRILN